MKLKILAALPLLALAAGASAAQGLSIERVLENDSGFCAVLSMAPDQSASPSDLAAYFRASRDGAPDEQAVPVISGRRVCFTGLRNGARYTLAVRQGLKYGGGLTLDHDLTATALIPDAKSAVFLERGQVLSRTLSSRKILLGAVNAPDLDAYVYRIPFSDLLASGALSMTSDSLPAYRLSNLLRSHAQLLGKTRLQIPKARNERVTAELDLDKAAGRQLEDGVYLVIACDPRMKFDGYNADAFYDDDRMWLSRLVTLTDLGVSAYRAENGIAVAVRSLKGANPAAAANVTLLSKSNDVLATAVTDASGYAQFDASVSSGRGAMEPAAVSVTSGQDAFVLSLAGHGLALKDAPSVRHAPAGTSLEAFAWTSRGIYRPGETVRYTALVRNKDLSASDLKALSLRITRPDGTAVKTLTLQNKGAGFFEGEYKLPDEGERGAWTFTLRSGERTDIAHTTVVTADFVPATLEAEIKGGSEIEAGMEASFTVASRYSYGAPGAGAQVSGMLTASPDPHPVEAFKDFAFGPDPERYSELTRSLPFNPVEAGASGEAKFTATIPDTGYAQKATLAVNAFAQGSEINTRRGFKIRTKSPIIGFRQSDGGFEAVICKDGKAIAGSAGYAIYKVETDYQYVFDRGEWKYLRNERLVPAAAGKLETADGKPASVKADLKDGFYLARLEMPGALTEARFMRGHAASVEGNSPESFKVTSDKESYAPDERVTLTFDAREDGGADLVVGSDSIKLMRRYEVHKGSNQITFKIPKDATVAERALITLTYPAGGSASGPRSMGLALLKINSQDKVLGAALKTPGTVKPGSTLEAELDITGADGSAMYSAALVDTGVLALTSYKAPAPEMELLKPEAYGIRAYDRYGALLHAFAPQGQGHGALGASMMKSALTPQALAALRGKVVALYSGVAKVEDGKAKLSFKIPEDFQGGLRLMAVAADGKAMGSASSDIAVLDAAAPSVSLPAILHEGDEVEGAISVQNTSGEDGQKLALSASCEGSISCSAASASLDLKNGQMSSVPLKAKALAAGDGKVKLELKGSGVSISRSYGVHVESADPMVLSSATAFIKEGDSRKLEPKPALAKVGKAQLVRGLMPGGTSAELLHKVTEAGYIPPADLSCIVLALSDLPHTDAKDASKVQDLVSLLQSRTGHGYGFADPALGALNAAALLRARQAGFDVSDELCDRLISSLKRSAGAKDPSGPISMMALAMIREGDLSDLRYSFDNSLSASPLSCAAYAAAFHAYGDDARATESLKKGFAALGTLDSLHEALASAANTEQALKAFEALSRFEPTVLSGPDFDRAALVAAAAITRNAQFISGADLSAFQIPDLKTMAVLARAGEASAGKSSSQEVETAADGSFNVINSGSGDAFYTLSAYGLPKKGAALSRKASARLGFYDISDQAAPALVSSLRRGVPAMMMFTVRRSVPHDSEVALRFALPAGFSFIGPVASDGALGKASGVIDCQAQSGDSGVVLKAWPSSTDFKVAVLVRPQFEGTLKVPAATLDESGILSSQLLRESSEVRVSDAAPQK
jgi:uncharacterized protein YfaS (alpha-2-macroglobulin family)